MSTLAEILAAPCLTCGGKEKVWRDCVECGGEGEVESTWDDAMGDEFMCCPHCGGRGGHNLCAKCAPPDPDDLFDA